MSYSFIINQNNYVWSMATEDHSLKRFDEYYLNEIQLKLRFQELFKTVKKVHKFGIELFNTLSDDDTELYEEVETKISNCNIFMKNSFDKKTQELLNKVQYSAENYERYLEILNSYTEIITRDYPNIMENELNQIGRNATVVYGIINDLQFTLEINNLLNLTHNKSNSIELVTDNYLINKTLGKEALNSTLSEKQLSYICA